MDNEKLSEIFNKNYEKHTLKKFIIEQLLKAINEEHWITIGADKETEKKGTHILVKDGETHKQATERKIAEWRSQKGKTNKPDEKPADDTGSKKENTNKSNYRIYREKEDKLYTELSEIYHKDYGNDDEKRKADIKKLADERQENYNKLVEAVKQETERLKNTDIDNASIDELKDFEKDARDLFYESGLSFSDRVYLQNKLYNIQQNIHRIETKEKADKIGGYTKKLNDMCGFTVFSDISSYPEDLQKHIYDNYKLVYDKYPQIRYGGISMGSLAERTYANNLSASNVVTLNEKRFTNLKDLEESYKKTVESKYHPQGTTYNSIITHELGHALLDYITKKTKVRGPEIRKKILNELNIKQKDLKEHLSEYSMAKPREAHEFFAEAFAEYMTSKNPRPIAVALGKEIERLLKD